MASSHLPVPEYEDFDSREAEAAPILDSTQYRVVLRNDEADVFLGMLRKLIRGGKVNQFFPNPSAWITFTA